ncbi:hypothetical protein ACWCQL_24090 [Streptomyces sp. NPDC002073]|nr:hypothetical protein [Streptomyces sp. NBC_00239]
MNEIISIAADVFALIGASISIAFEVRRARNEAGKAARDDTQE